MIAIKLKSVGAGDKAIYINFVLGYTGVMLIVFIQYHEHIYSTLFLPVSN